MKIGIIGAGRVGTTLGEGLARAGHLIVYGVREPGGERHREPPHAGAEVRTIKGTVAASEALILATPWNAAEAALAAAGDLGNRVLIDATNPIGDGLALTHGRNDSGGEQVARWARNARVIKAFNSTGFENMADPVYGDARAAMLVCGDDADARAVALGLARDLGFDAVDAGGLSKARLLEPLALLWIHLATAQGHGRSFAFGILRRQAPA